MSPEVDGLAVPLKRRQEVAAPGSAERPVPGGDVVLPEVVRSLGGSRGAGHGGRDPGERPRDLLDLLQADEQAAQTLQNHACH